MHQGRKNGVCKKYVKITLPQTSLQPRKPENYGATCIEFWGNRIAHQGYCASLYLFLVWGQHKSMLRKLLSVLPPWKTMFKNIPGTDDMNWNLKLKTKARKLQSSRISGAYLREFNTPNQPTVGFWAGCWSVAVPVTQMGLSSGHFFGFASFLALGHKLVQPQSTPHNYHGLFCHDR